MAECISRSSELPKQDCTSPSPTETVCLESLCAENIPGKITGGQPISELFNNAYKI